MAKKLLCYFCLHTVLFTLFSCDGMAALFHGPKLGEEVPMFTVTFDANGATGVVPDAQTVSRGTVITMPGEGDLAKGGDVFTGWNVSGSGGGTTYPPESPYTVTADQTFYAQWADPSQVYTVTYDANGASGSPPSSLKAVHNGNIIVAGRGDLVNANKTFAGWNTTADGMGANYNVGAPLSVTTNMTLYAQWLDPSVQRYTVTYHANGASGAPPSAQTVNEWNNITLPGAGGLAYSGKLFNGWNTAANGTGTRYAAGAAFTVTGNTAFYAQWIREPVVPQGSTVAEQLLYIAGHAEDGAVYIITVKQDETPAPQTLFYGGKNVSVILKGDSVERIVSLSSNDALFAIGNLVTLMLGDNITLEGRASNINSLVVVSSGGELVMNTGSKISGNSYSTATYSYGGGVYVSSGGTFTMSGGTISGNIASASSIYYHSYGGGVYVSGGGTFTMSGGTISGNISSSGGGVYVYSGGTFTKQSGGTIYGSDAALKNTATEGDSDGHAVYVSSYKKRNNTAGTGITMDSSKDGAAGGWE